MLSLKIDKLNLYNDEISNSRYVYLCEHVVAYTIDFTTLKSMPIPCLFE